MNKKAQIKMALKDTNIHTYINNSAFALLVKFSFFAYDT